MRHAEDVLLLARSLRAALGSLRSSGPELQALVLDLITAPLVSDLGEDNAFAVAEAALETDWSEPGHASHLVTASPSATIAGYVRDHLGSVIGADRATVLEGDPAATVPVHLRRIAELDPAWRTAHSIAVVDPFGLDVPWSFYESVAPFRRGEPGAGPGRVELWLYLGPAFDPRVPAQLRRGAAGAYPERMLRLLGDDHRWVDLHDARVRGALDPVRYQAEQLNLVRWKLESELGYAHTVAHRFPTSDPRRSPSVLVIASATVGAPHLDSVADVVAAARGGSGLGDRLPDRPSRPRRFDPGSELRPDVDRTRA